MEKVIVNNAYSLQLKLFRYSISWRVALAWIVVATIAFHFLVYPIISIIFAYMGYSALPALVPLNWSELMTIIITPIAGAIADRVATGLPDTEDNND